MFVFLNGRWDVLLTLINISSCNYVRMSLSLRTWYIFSLNWVVVNFTCCYVQSSSSHSRRMFIHRRWYTRPGTRLPSSDVSRHQLLWSTDSLLIDSRCFSLEFPRIRRDLRPGIRGLRNSAIRFGIGISKTEPCRTELFIEFRKSRNSDVFGISAFALRNWLFSVFRRLGRS